MDYYFRHTDIVDHPQVLAAGFWGAKVFDAVCDVNAARDFGGEVPKSYLDPVWLVRWMNLQPCDVPNGDPIQTVCHAMSRCFVTGLLVESDRGAIIDGWDRRQPNAPKTAAQRKRKQRESQDMSRMSRNVVTVTNVTTGEERRGEEKRKKLPAASPPVADAAAVPASDPEVAAQPTTVAPSAYGIPVEPDPQRPGAWLVPWTDGAASIVAAKKPNPLALLVEWAMYRKQQRGDPETDFAWGQVLKLLKRHVKAHGVELVRKAWLCWLVDPWASSLSPPYQLTRFLAVEQVKRQADRAQGFQDWKPIAGGDWDLPWTLD